MLPIDILAPSLLCEMCVFFPLGRRRARACCGERVVGDDEVKVAGLMRLNVLGISEYPCSLSSTRIRPVTCVEGSNNAIEQGRVEL